MKLYLLRHGHAVADYEDPVRPLSEGGVTEVRALAERIASLEIQVNKAFHSPKRRAHQTALEFVGRVLPEAILEETSGLLPMDPPGAWIDRLEESESDLLLVGHNPFMSELAELLVRRPVGFPTAGFLGLERHGPSRWEIFLQDPA